MLHLFEYLYEFLHRQSYDVGEAAPVAPDDHAFLNGVRAGFVIGTVSVHILFYLMRRHVAELHRGAHRKRARPPRP